MGLSLLRIKLSKEEFWTGFTHSFAWTPFQGWYSLPSALISGFLWALGGSGLASKLVRRLGCPLTICASIWAYKGGYYHFISIPFAFWVLSLGYGIPSWNGPNGSQDDEGSFLGRFCYYALCKGPDFKDLKVERCAERKTRAILALLFGLAMVSIIPYSWVYWVIGTGVLIVIVPIIVSTI